MIEINLLPEEILKRKKVRAFAIFISISAMIAIMICTLLFFIGPLSIRERMKLAQAQLSLVKEKTDRYKLILKKMKALEKENVELQARLDSIRNLITNQFYLPQVLSEISKSLPENIWLTELTTVAQEKEETVAIQGSSLTQTIDIAEFMENLDKSLFFEKISFSIISRRRIKDMEVMDFKINCKLVKSTR